MNNFHREKTPVMLQMDNAECGAIALGIILAYFGLHLPPSQLREACGVSRDGSKAINIIKAARQYGMEAHGIQRTLEEVKQLPAPFIVFWEFNHFLIVEGFGKHKVFLNDPATGPRTVSHQEFNQGFTGIVLFMTPGENFKPAGEPEPSLLVSFWRQIANMRWNWIYILTISVLQIFPIISLAFLTKIFFDYILLEKKVDLLINVLLGIGVSGVFFAGLTWLQRHYRLYLFIKIKLEQMIQFYWRLLHLPLDFFEQRAIGDLAERVEANSSLADMLVNKIPAHIAGLISMALLVIFMFLLNKILAVISITLVLLNFALLSFITLRNRDLGGRYKQMQGKLASIEINGVKIIETLKANAMENDFFNQWSAAHAQKTLCAQRLALNSFFLKILPFFFQVINTIIVLGLGGWFIMHQQLSPGGLISFEILLINFTFILLELLNINENYARFKGDIARINDINEQPIEQKPSVQNRPLDFSKPQLEFSNILFGYSRLEPPIFENISFSVNPGERIAIVGPTGGGKSSIAKLICRLASPWSGEIRIHGSPLVQFARADLARMIGLVDQNIFLFSASVRDNLTLWNKNIRDQEIYHALSLVEMADIISKRGGLNYKIEEYGRNFSGGQVQRLEIARALIQSPKILILDEATSALDPLLEQEIYNNLRQKNCTLIIIAHRLSAIKDCDQILVIKNGKIVQQGRHEKLIQDSGLYQELVSLEIQ